jgi:hypothetical protein
MEEVLNNLTDANGNAIRKADGTAYTVDEWIALSNAERDALNINGAFGEQLEDYVDDLQDYADKLDELKTKGIDELRNAFSELTEDIKD